MTIWRTAYEFSGYTSPAVVDYPYISSEDPAPGETGVSIETNIEFNANDFLEGVDSSTISVTISINGGPAVDAIILGVFQAPFDGPSSAITALPGGNNYSVVIDYTGTFPQSSVITVVPTFSDLAANVLPATSYSFTIGYPPGPRPDVAGRRYPKKLYMTHRRMVRLDIDGKDRQRYREIYPFTRRKSQRSS